MRCNQNSNLQPIICHHTWSMCHIAISALYITIKMSTYVLFCNYIQTVFLIIINLPNAVITCLLIAYSYKCIWKMHGFTISTSYAKTIPLTYFLLYIIICIVCHHHYHIIYCGFYVKLQAGIYTCVNCLS
jgi:hypothetical protein